MRKVRWTVREEEAMVATKRIAPSSIAVAGSSRTSDAGSGCFNFSRAPIWQDKKNTRARSQIKVFLRLTTRLLQHKKAARDFKNGVFNKMITLLNTKMI